MKSPFLAFVYKKVATPQGSRSHMAAHPPGNYVALGRRPDPLSSGFLRHEPKITKGFCEDEIR